MISCLYLTGEKVTLGISILLSLVVFLLLVSKILPPTSLVLPLIAKYLLFTFLMNCMSILATVIIINWNFRGPRTHKMPNWVRTVFLKYLPVLLFIRRPKKTRLRWMMDMPNLGVHYHPYHPDRQRQEMSQAAFAPDHPKESYPFSKPRDLDFTEEPSSCLPSSGHHHHEQHHQHHLHQLPQVSPQHLHHQSNGHSHQDHPHSHHHTCNAAQSSCLSPAHLHHPSHDLLHRNNSILSDNGCGPLGPPPSGHLMDVSPGGSSCHSPKEDDSMDTLYLTPEAYRATEAIEFIAEHLRSEDEYIQVSSLLKSSLCSYLRHAIVLMFSLWSFLLVSLCSSQFLVLVLSILLFLCL